MTKINEQKFQVVYNGQTHEVSERKFLFIQRLENAIGSIISGQTISGGVVEVAANDKMRGFYFVESDAKYDSLLTHWDNFKGYVKNDMVKFQGNAPLNNRSFATN